MLDTLIAPLVTLIVAAAVQLAFSSRAAATPLVYVALLAPYGALGAVAMYRLRRDGSLAAAFRFRWGDISFGVLVGALLVGACWVGRAALAPAGSPGEAWVTRIYLHLGEVPSQRGALLGFAAALVTIALLEELVWRGLVQPALAKRLGARRGWLGESALYALAHVPTAWNLQAPSVGPNPLIVMAALFCGSVWGFLASRLQRLPPSLIAHAYFSYAIMTQFPLWSLH